MSRLYNLYMRDRISILGGGKEPPVPEASGEEDIPVLETLMENNRFQELPSLMIDESELALEEFRCLSKNLKVLAGAGLKSLLICGAAENVGTSTVSQNLAVIMARSMESRILLVAADTSTTSPVIPGEARKGWWDFLEDQRPLEQYIHPTNETHLFVMGPGRNPFRHYSEGGPGGLEHSFSELRARYPFLLFDGAPVSDQGTLLLSGYVDGVLLVVRSGSLIREVQKAKTLLCGRNAKILGAVLNRIHS